MLVVPSHAIKRPKLHALITPRTEQWPPLAWYGTLCPGVAPFACLDTTTKYLTQTYNVPLVVAIRYLVHFTLMLVLLAPIEGRRLVQTTHSGWVLLRGASLAAVSLCVGLALSRMPVAETTAIVFLAPIAVVMLAVPLLGERLGRWGWGPVWRGSSAFC